MALFGTGCSLLSPCKPGKPAKPKPFHVTVNLDPSLQQSSVVVDLVAVSEGMKSQWEGYKMSDYWKDGDAMRKDADSRGDKYTLSFVSGQSLSQSMGRLDPKWKQWIEQKRATHIFVLADLPGGRADLHGTQDPRRQILSLDPCYWPKKTTNLIVNVQRSGIVPPAPRPPK